MAGINKCILVGRLGRDPEIRYTQSGTAVTNLNLATSEKYKDKSGGMQEKTEWHRIVAFGRVAEIAEKYLGKGSQVYIEGKLQTRSYEKEGQMHYSTEVVANTVQFLDSKGGQGQGQGQSQSQGRSQGGSVSDDDGSGIPF